MRTTKTALAFLAALLFSVALPAQAPEATASWKVTANAVSDNEYELLFTASIVDGWHIYTTAHQFNPTEVVFDSPAGYEPQGSLEQVTEPVMFEGQEVFFGSAQFRWRVLLTQPEATVKGEITWSGCNDQFCAAPESKEFSVTLESPADAEASEGHSTEISDPEAGTGGGKGLWGLILEAILWGFAMLLTPCVFPMVPMTISFFMKQSETPAQGRLKAFIYGLFIVLLYTLPICAIIGITLLVGGNSVTADIFNWLATHWLPNLLFFIIFMVFAASFFGAFEIELPSSLTNKSDAKSGGKGLGGIFFMALTLVLVSFSCTGPIVGTVLIKSTQGEFWSPMVSRSHSRFRSRSWLCSRRF